MPHTPLPESTIYVGIIYAIITCILSIYFGYCLYKFVKTSHTFKDENFFKHRHNYSNYLCLFSFFITAFIIDPIEVTTFIVRGSDDTLSINRSILLVNDITLIAMFATFLWRSWLFFCDWMFHCNMKSWIWQREINPLQTNFFIKYRRVFGDPKIIFAILFFALFLPIILILDLVPQYVFIKHDGSPKVYIILLFRLSIFSVLVSLTLAMILSLKKVLDVYKIRLELLYEISIFGVLLLVSEIISIALLYFELIDNSAYFLLRACQSSLTGICVLFVGTNWVLKQYEIHQLWKSFHHSNSTAVETNSDICFDLIDILNDKNGFELFVQHLVREFELEKMLFLLEVNQFKQEIQQRIRRSKPLPKGVSNALRLKSKYITNNDGGITIDFDTCSDDTESTASQPVSLMFKINLELLKLPQDPRMKQWTLYQFAVHLYDKYIDDGADLKLTVSSNCQKFIYSYFQDRLLNHESTPFSTPNDSSHSSPILVKRRRSVASVDIAAIIEENRDQYEDANDVTMSDGFNKEIMDINLEVPNARNQEIDDVEPTTPILDYKGNAYLTTDAVAGHNKINNDSIDMKADSNIAIVYDLYRLFDSAGAEMWATVSTEIFNRFKTTKEYHQYCTRKEYVNHSNGTGSSVVVHSNMGIQRLALVPNDSERALDLRDIEFMREIKK